VNGVTSILCPMGDGFSGVEPSGSAVMLINTFSLLLSMLKRILSF
jgi:hypothetical protein